MFFLLTAIVPNPNPDQELASGAPRAAQEVARAKYVAETFAGLAPKLLFILVPVFALLLKLAYWRHRRTLLKAFAVAVSYVAVLITATVGLIVVLLH